jgi:hypothetical protein
MDPLLSSPGNLDVISIADSNTLTNDVENARLSLHEAVDARKAAERDAQLLINRINLLKNEELKALKNIEMTKAKVKTVTQVKLDVVRHELDQRINSQYRKEQTNCGLDKNQYAREVARANREQVRKQLLEEKARVAHETRLDLERRIEETFDFERAERERIHRRTEAIKQERIEAKKRLEAERIERLKSFRQQYETRLSVEERKRQESEALIAKLEREELELIERLRRAQEVQSKIHQEIDGRCPVTPITAAVTPAKHQAKYMKQEAPIISPLGRWDVGGAALR